MSHSLNSTTYIKHIPSLTTFPVELLYRILDQLDSSDILVSFRNVCKRFYTITNTYNRYRIKITSTSRKADIHRVCRLIQPENVVSCVVISTIVSAHEITDRVSLFLSLIDIPQFTQLHSLDLFFDMDKLDVKKMMHLIFGVPNLMSLSLRWRDDGYMCHDAIDLLSSIIVMPSLRKLCLRYIDPKIYRTLRPNQCKLQALAIDSCTPNQLCDILYHLPNLRSFSSNDYDSMDETNQIVPSTSFPLLTSLRLQSLSCLLIDQLEILLSFTPLLVHLHIASHRSTLSFLQRLSQWEPSIRDHLSLLEKFEFYIFTADYDYENVKDVELIMNSFRTSFWLEEKRWYVTCQYINNDIRPGLVLRSPIISNVDFPDNFSSNIISYSASTSKNDRNKVTMNSTWIARLNLSAMNEAISSNEVCANSIH